MLLRIHFNPELVDALMCQFTVIDCFLRSKVYLVIFSNMTPQMSQLFLVKDTVSRLFERRANLTSDLRFLIAFRSSRTSCILFDKRQFDAFPSTKISYFLFIVFSNVEHFSRRRRNDFSDTYS